MPDQISFLQSEAPSRDSRPGSLSSLPADLLDQIRGRVRLLAIFLTIGFSIDPLLYFANLGAARLAGVQLPGEFYQRLPFQWGNLGGALASALLWAVTRHRGVAPARLLTLGLAYEVAICFVIAFGTIWEYHFVRGHVPLMTWVNVVVILFPVILPGPPRRMLLAAIAAASMVPLSLVVLGLMGVVQATPDDYSDAVIQGAFSVALAYMGARVVYGLGREVAKARELGSYRLIEKLGEGGMGEVWRAQHRMLARPAAIKLIREAPGRAAKAAFSDDARQRFEREAQAIASLRSPHTVELFDFGVAQDGTFYYAMELLEGLDADTLVRRFGPVVPERVIYLLQQVCHSLAEAESFGLVHRDIKPANIFLCRYGIEYDFVKVLDFGLVKSLDDGASDRRPTPALTKDTVIQGTPAFMAPEQALGGAALDVRADIYATGCVAYWLLTGQVPFTADTAMGILLHHAGTTPTPPSSRSALSIPDALDQLVLSCLAKDPADRPQTARELSQRLAAIPSAQPWSQDRAREWWVGHEGPASWRRDQALSLERA
jgi:eukaryotic-like serine/threonine-protein kinase